MRLGYEGDEGGGIPATRADGGQHVGGSVAHVGGASGASACPTPRALRGTGNVTVLFLRWSEWASIGSVGD
jgi:hypothetical protein